MEPPAPLGAAAQSTTNLDAVEVTGTRIKRAEVEGQVPIQTLTRGDIERTGLGSIGEVLARCRDDGQPGCHGLQKRVWERLRRGAEDEDVEVAVEGVVDLQLADRGYIIQEGRIVLEGRSGELMKNNLVKKAYLGR